MPPEEFLISRRATGLADASFVAHRVKKTASQLIEQGYSRKIVEDLPGDDAQPFNEERIERFRAEDEAPETGDSLDPAMKEIWITGMLSAHRCRRRRRRRAAQDHHRRRPRGEAAGQ
jgi:hypothetical protein